MEKELVIKRVVNGVEENFPSNNNPAVLKQFSFESTRMGSAPEITAELMWPTCLDDEWTDDVFVTFEGERYNLYRRPSSEKDNKDERWKHSLTFRNDRAILAGIYVYDAVDGESLNPSSNNTTVRYAGNLNGFVAKLNASLKASGLRGIENQTDKFVVVVDDGITTEDKTISFEDKYFTEALTEAVETWGVPYYICAGTGAYAGVTVIHFGEYKAGSLIGSSQQPLTYRTEGLTMSKREHSGNDVINRATGYGSSENLPWYYPNESVSGVHNYGGPLYVANRTRINIDAISKAIEGFAADHDEKLAWFKGYPYVTKPSFCEVYLRGGYVVPPGAEEHLFIEKGVNVANTFGDKSGSTQSASFVGREITGGRKTITLLFAGIVNSYGTATFDSYAKSWLNIPDNSASLDSGPGDLVTGYGYLRFAGAGFRVTGSLAFDGELYSKDDVLASDGNGWYRIPASETIWYEEPDGHHYTAVVSEGLFSKYYDLFATIGFFFQLDAGQTINMSPVKECSVQSRALTPSTVQGSYYARVVSLGSGSTSDLLARAATYLENRGTVEQPGFDDNMNYVENIKHIIPLTELSGAAAGTEMIPDDGKYSFTASSSGLYLFEFRMRYDIPNDVQFVGNKIVGSFVFGLHRDFWFDVVSPQYKRILEEGQGTNDVAFYASNGWIVLDSSITPSDGDYLTISQIDHSSWLTPQPNLMPSIYRNSLQKRRFYGAKNYPYTPEQGETPDTEAGEYLGQDGKIHNDLYLDAGDNPYQFGFLYDKNKPIKTVEHIGRYDDIKASITGIVNSDTPPKPIDEFLAIEFDTLDNNLFEEDTQGNNKDMEHPYFFVKLPRMPFNIFDCIGTEPATISMTTGLCASCKFEIYVQKDTNYNIVQVKADGTLDRDSLGNVKFGDKQDRQNNTIDNEVWVALKKDISTYGESYPMPYASIRDSGEISNAIQPAVGDKYVLTGIYMPYTYILQAEERLSKKIVSDIYANNFHKFNIGIHFSRIYLQENPVTVLSKLCDAAKIWVKHNTTDAAVALFVSSFKYNVNKEALPEVTVELADSLIPNQNTIQLLEAKVTQNVLDLTEDVTKPITAAKMDSTEEEPVALVTSKNRSAIPRTQFLENIGLKETGNKNRPVYVDNERKIKPVEGIDVPEDIHSEKAVKADEGLEVGNFKEGMSGQGAKVDQGGHAEMRSLKLWEWLEVPELRYNRISIYTGIRWDTFGGGIIEEITPDPTGVETGTGKLKLEPGDIGAIAVGDLCMGIWHDTFGNDSETTDDHQGNFKFAGFKTVYFQITAISGVNNQNFSYMLRSAAQGGNGIHPFAGMHFAGRGNISNTARQAFLYTTTEYSLALTGVNTWQFQSLNIIQISGKLDGFSMPAVDKYGQPYMKVFSGYGQVFGNAYIFGQLDQFERVGYRATVDQSKGGAMAPGESEVITVTVWNGYGEDCTAQFTHYSVTRDTGDHASDALWNSQHESVTNPFTITFNDLGIDGIHKLLAVFTVVASDEVNGIEAQQATVDYFS